MRGSAWNCVAATIAIVMAVVASSAHNSDAYHPSRIGTPGKPWGADEYKLWRQTRPKQRSYFDLAPRILALGHKAGSKGKEESPFEVVHYGDLAHDDDDDDDAAKPPNASSASFPLYAVRSANWSPEKPNIFITGGVHGYETSGVEGAMLFVTGGKAVHYSQHFNFLIVPCVSPWGYERIQRWTAKGTDPNRSFNPDGEIVEGRSFNPEAATDESTALIRLLREDAGGTKWTCHLDLHETTDTDETEFGPAKAARDGVPDDGSKGEIPDGFYLVQDETSPMPAWHAAMIAAVRKVTHIAPADAQGKIIGEPVSQEGVITIPCNKALGLCAGVTNAPYRSTTEVYPDSPSATPEECNRAQVACIEGALDHLLSVL